MKIGIFHGYELTGSGSNEYTKYLAETLSQQGHEVHVICREPASDKISFISGAYEYTANGDRKVLFEKNILRSKCVVHKLPDASVKPVFLTDKQRSGNVKSFVNLTDEELKQYHDINKAVIENILEEQKLDILHANHLIYQPVAVYEACKKTGTPFIIYPHGSSIEYVVKPDERYKKLAFNAIKKCDGLIIGNKEVRDRIVKLYPEYKEFILEKTQIVGVGVDTELFKPIQKNQRNNVISDLLKRELTGGKKDDQTLELIDRLNAGNIFATRDYWNAYNHSKPDDNIKEKLENIPWNKNILLFVGALTVGKGLQSLIVALTEIITQKPDTHLVIVGAGAYREVLEGLVHAISSGNKKLVFELCSKGYDLDKNDLKGEWADVKKYLDCNIDLVIGDCSKLREHVHFLGRLDHDNLKYIFPCSDIAVFPSVVPEAYPLVLMESLSNGVLPVVSYFSGFKDGIDELEQYLGEEIVDRMKISVNPEDRISTIVENILFLLDNFNFSSNSSKLREIAVHNYDWKIRAEELVDAYNNVLHEYCRVK